jgi:D-alanyl-D-alanine carboxypeptidase (penicillin-binding protein 5/6)
MAEMLADGNLELAAKGAIVIDAYTGRPLFEKNPDSTCYPASTTKIMTALLVIEAGNLDHIVEIADEDSRVGESGLSIKPGECYTRRQMLFGLMLKSANDVAHALGRDNAGTMEAFTAKMTLRAQELGAKNTLFRNAHGLHDVEHYTNARDLAAITRAAMQQPFFREIVTTRAFTWQRTDGPWIVSNHNRLLKEFPGCTGVKTGYTRPAQQVLASAALRDGREVIAVVMHTNKPGIWEDSKLLLNYGLKYAPGTGPALRPPPVSLGGN